MSMETALKSIRQKIKTTQENSLLSVSAVTLLGACKGQPPAKIEAAIAAGVTDFGENRVQEAAEKWPPLRAKYPQLRLHLIGPLQTNKVGQALGLFDVIQTVDRMKLADEIAKVKHNTHHSSLTTWHFFIQVNTGKEPQKAGVMPEEADALIDYCKTQLQLPIAGLMCVPPVGQPAAPHFAYLRQLAQAHGLRELSMGMSGDFETAVRMGSTCVRLGRVLFGERPHD